MKMITIMSSALLLLSASAHAEIAGLTHFVPNGEFAVTFEPAITFSDPAGLGGDFKFTSGITDLNNVTGILGTSGGTRGFRAGLNFTFDIFPDLDGQPGIGIAAQGIYYRVSGSASVSGATDTVGQLETAAIPYIHKSFRSGTDEYEPFLAIPMGWAFSQGTYAGISQVTVGSLFKNSEHIRYSMEFGIGVNHQDSYIAGGIIYYH